MAQQDRKRARRIRKLGSFPEKIAVLYIPSLPAPREAASRMIVLAICGSDLEAHFAGFSRGPGSAIDSFGPVPPPGPGIWIWEGRKEPAPVHVPEAAEVTIDGAPKTAETTAEALAAEGEITAPSEPTGEAIEAKEPGWRFVTHGWRRPDHLEAAELVLGGDPWWGLRK